MPIKEVVLYYEGKVLKDSNVISKYCIRRNSTIFFAIRLRVGTARKGTPSSSKPSFKEVVNKRLTPVQTIEIKLVEYIVEKSTQSPYIELEDTIILKLYEPYTTRAIICRFNGLWPKTEHLNEWVYQNWSLDVEITLCAK